MLWERKISRRTRTPIVDPPKGAWKKKVKGTQKRKEFFTKLGEKMFWQKQKSSQKETLGEGITT